MSRGFCVFSDFFLVLIYCKCITTVNKVYQSLTRKGIKGGRQRKDVLKQINNSLAQGGLKQRKGPSEKY